MVTWRITGTDFKPVQCNLSQLNWSPCYVLCPDHTKVHTKMPSFQSKVIKVVSVSKLFLLMDHWICFQYQYGMYSFEICCFFCQPLKNMTVMLYSLSMVRQSKNSFTRSVGNSVNFFLECCYLLPFLWYQIVRIPFVPVCFCTKWSTFYLSLFTLVLNGPVPSFFILEQMGANDVCSHLVRTKNFSEGKHVHTDFGFCLVLNGQIAFVPIYFGIKLSKWFRNRCLQS